MFRGKFMATDLLYNWCEIDWLMMTGRVIIVEVGHKPLFFMYFLKLEIKI